MEAKKVRRREGQVVRIDLGSGRHAYGLVLKEPVMAFYDREFSETDPTVRDIVSLPIAFKIPVMNFAVTDGIWPVVGTVTLTPELRKAPEFFKQDVFTGELSIYQEVLELAPFYERPATYQECADLECAAVWEPHHVEDRLRALFNGHQCPWTYRPKARDDCV